MRRLDCLFLLLSLGVSAKSLAGSSLHPLIGGEKMNPLEFVVLVGLTSITVIVSIVLIEVIVEAGE